MGGPVGCRRGHLCADGLVCRRRDRGHHRRIGRLLRGRVLQRGALVVRAQAGRSWPTRVLVANGLAARSIAVEFGPAEAIDSVTIRPIALYLGPLVVGNTAVGFVLGSIVADIAFYAMTIFSYERFTKLLVRPQPASVPA